MIKFQPEFGNNLNLKHLPSFQKYAGTSNIAMFATKDHSDQDYSDNQIKDQNSDQVDDQECDQYHDQDGG